MTSMISKEENRELRTLTPVFHLPFSLGRGLSMFSVNSLFIQTECSGKQLLFCLESIVTKII